TDVPVALAAALMIVPDDQETRKLALRAGIRLQRNRGKAGNFRQPMLQLIEENPVSLGLLRRSERMNLAELRPAQGNHLGSCIQFHSAGAERDHGSSERKVPRFEPVNVTKQFGLRMITVENGMGKIAGSTFQLRGDFQISLLREILDTE